MGVHKTATIMSTQTVVQTAPKKSGIEILKATLKADSITEQFRNALKDNSGPFTASIIDLYNSDNNLQACSNGSTKGSSIETSNQQVFGLCLHRTFQQFS